MSTLDNIQITTEILQLIAEIDEFKGKWLALKNIAPDRLSNLRHVATIESIGSSTRIEGATLSDKEIEDLMKMPLEDIKKLYDARDIEPEEETAVPVVATPEEISD